MGVSDNCSGHSIETRQKVSNLKLSNVKKEVPYDIIARVLSGEATTRNREDVKHWTEECDENKSLFEEMQTLWNSVGNSELEIDTEKALSKINLKINKAKGRSFSFGLIMKIAAGIAVIVVSGFLLKLTILPDKLLELKTAVNETKSIQLEDGTIISLNENSTLSYPEHFETNNRTVQLKGEAFFDVQHDSLRPFMIKAGNTITKVLGTAFIIRARDKEKNISVSVHRGKVSFSNTDGEVILTMGEKGIADLHSGKISETANDNLNDLSWQTKTLIFIGTPMNKVVEQLSYYYKIDIRLENNMLDSIKFSGQFNNSKIEDILKNIELATGHTFQKQGENFLFK